MNAMAAIDQNVPSYTHNVLRVPNFDADTLEQYPPFYTPILTVLVEIDQANPLELFNLTALGDIVIDNEILNVIRLFYRDEITQHRRCPFMLTLHRDKDLMHHHYLMLDDDMNVSLTEQITLDGIYRVSFCILTNTSVLPHHVWSGLATNSVALHQYVHNVNMIPIEGSHTLGSDSHGINPKVIASDFTAPTHYLKSFSP